MIAVAGPKELRPRWVHVTSAMSPPNLVGKPTKAEFAAYLENSSLISPFQSDAEDLPFSFTNFTSRKGPATDKKEAVSCARLIHPLRSVSYLASPRRSTFRGKRRICRCVFYCGVLTDVYHMVTACNFVLSHLTSKTNFRTIWQEQEFPIPRSYFSKDSTQLLHLWRKHLTPFCPGLSVFLHIFP